MGIRDWLRGKSGGPSSPGQGSSGEGRIPRFAPISENDEMLLPEQVGSMKVQLRAVKTDVVQLQEPTIDAMLPECALFIPNLIAEFTENPNLAMIHGRGRVHASIDVKKRREALAAKADQITDYRSLFRAFTEQGYDVKR
jgi:hypothetical protein